MFFFFGLAARNIPVAKENQKVHEVVTATEDGSSKVSVEELVSMDYSPATRKPPIHN